MTMNHQIKSLKELEAEERHPIDKANMVAQQLAIIKRLEEIRDKDYMSRLQPINKLIAELKGDEHV
jgi:hypothetical protein